MQGKGGGPKVIWTDERLDELADAMIAFFEDNPTAYFIEEFCSAHGLWRQRISEWEKRNEKLADARKRVDEITSARIAKLALTNGANPTFSIFALKQKGWSDQRQVDLTTKGEALPAAQICIYGTDSASDTE